MHQRLRYSTLQLLETPLRENCPDCLITAFSPVRCGTISEEASSLLSAGTPSPCTTTRWTLPILQDQVQTLISLRITFSCLNSSKYFSPWPTPLQLQIHTTPSLSQSSLECEHIQEKCCVFLVFLSFISGMSLEHLAVYSSRISKCGMGG